MNSSTGIKVTIALLSFLTLIILAYFALIQYPLNHWRSLRQRDLLLRTQQTPAHHHSSVSGRIKNHVNTPFLILWTTKMAEKSNLNELKIKPLKRRNQNSLIIDQLQITGHGPFENVMVFYELLFQAPIFFTMEKWEWIKSTKNEIIVKANAEVYHY